MSNTQLNKPSITIKKICKTCTFSSKCRSFKRSKSNMKCLAFCSCKIKCKNKSIM